MDLLVPSANETFPTVAVPELRAHATALPYLKYLLEESQTSVLMAREGREAVYVLVTSGDKGTPDPAVVPAEHHSHGPDHPRTTGRSICARTERV